MQDSKNRPVVAVTGMGLLSALGRGCEDNWQALIAGRLGLRRITRFQIEGLRSNVAGTVDDYLPGVGQLHSVARSTRMAEAVCEEAIAQAAIGARHDFPGPLFIATPPSEFEWPQLVALERSGSSSAQAGYRRMLTAARDGSFMREYSNLQFTSIADALASPEAFGTKGQPISVCTACASGATAIGLGVEAIRRGDTDAALCVGTDGSIHPEAMVRFSLLSALSSHNDPPEKALRPFAKERDGFVPAEGAAALVLENYDAARARGATVLGIVMGYGEKSDDYHRTRSKPDGRAMIGAIAGALQDAGLSPDTIDYVNAHGTGTPENDKMEYLSLKAVLGERAHQVPVSSSKSMIGHTLIAAGALEAVISLKAIASGIMPPTMNCETPDPAIPLDVIAGTSRAGKVRTVLSNSFGFGGQNACLVFAGEPE